MPCFYNRFRVWYDDVLGTWSPTPSRAEAPRAELKRRSAPLPRLNYATPFPFHIFFGIFTASQDKKKKKEKKDGSDADDSGR